jgi:hypothetical protein
MATGTDETIPTTDRVLVSFTTTTARAVSSELESNNAKIRVLEAERAAMQLRLLSSVELVDAGESPDSELNAVPERDIFTELVEIASKPLNRPWPTTPKEGQGEVLRETWDLRRDCAARLVTGGGKTLLYVLPAAASRGITLVISMLRALIIEQVSRLAAEHGPEFAVHFLRSRESDAEPRVDEATPMAVDEAAGGLTDEDEGVIVLDDLTTGLNPNSKQRLSVRRGYVGCGALRLRNCRRRRRVLFQGRPFAAARRCLRGGLGVEQEATP